jgi:hypothetical protein
MNSIRIGNIEIRSLPEPFESENGYSLDLPVHQVTAVNRAKAIGQGKASRDDTTPMVVDPTEIHIWLGRLNIVFGVDATHSGVGGKGARVRVFVMNFEDVDDATFRSAGFEDGVFIRPAGEDRLYRVTAAGVVPTDKLVLPTEYVTAPVKLAS